MTTQLLPQSYEEIMEDPELQENCVKMGWLRPPQEIVIIPDDLGRPVVYLPKQGRLTPQAFGEEIPWESLFGETAAETQEIMQELNFEAYQP
jgi:hypothetical protein